MQAQITAEKSSISDQSTTLNLSPRLCWFCELLKTRGLDLQVGSDKSLKPFKKFRRTILVTRELSRHQQRTSVRREALTNFQRQTLSTLPPSDSIPVSSSKYTATARPISQYPPQWQTRPLYISAPSYPHI